MKFKFVLVPVLALVTALSLCACATSESAATEAPVAAPVATAEAPTATPEPTVTPEPTPEPIELTVFADSSMTETLTELGNKYMEANPHVTLQFNFDSSDTLQTRIREGATVDIFISAGQKQMDRLDKTASAEINTDGLDFVLSETRFNVLADNVVLAVPEGNPKDILSYDDMVAGLKAGTIMLAIGNADIPVGEYARKVLAYFELSEEALADAGLVTYGTNVKDVITQISEVNVDCGFICQTDAFSAKLTVVDIATEEMCGQVIYPAAVMNISEHIEAAQAFLDYLKGDEAGAVFSAVGFTPPA